MNNATRRCPAPIAGVLMALLGCSLAGCGEGDDVAETGDGGSDTPVDPAWYEPDPDGRQTEDNRIDAPPEMVIVTQAGLASAWRELARHRTVTGIPTEVVLLEDIKSAFDGADEAEKLRNYLIDAHAAGLRFALMGGDAEVVPYRRVEDAVSLVAVTYTTAGPTQGYFANLDIDWNADGDGSWGEGGDDVSLAELREDEIAVGRVPASHTAEVERYVAKLVRYETAPAARETYPLLFSDIASSVPLLGDIDGAEGVEATVQAFFPQAFRDHARRLYATDGAAAKYGGETLTPQKVSDALDEGYLLAYHNGHGSHGLLTGELDAEFVASLSNELPPVLLSCSCLTGNFADIATGTTYDNWERQGVDDDSAGELLITGQGGAVAYVGNTGVGLGPIGGSQFLHAMFEGIFEEHLATIGEAFAFGRARMRQVNLTILNTPMVMTDESERWTQLVVILLGDPSLPVWTQDGEAIAVSHPADYGPGYNEIVVEVHTPSSDAPVAGASVVLFKQDDFVLRSETDADGTATFRFVPYGPAELHVGVTSSGRVPAVSTIAPTE